MNPLIRPAAGAALLVALLAGASDATSPRNYLTIEGQATDHLGEPLPGTWVFCTGSRRASAVADSTGDFHLEIPGATLEELERTPLKIRVAARRKGWRFALAGGAAELGLEMRVTKDESRLAYLRVRSNDSSAVEAVASSVVLDANPRALIEAVFVGSQGSQIDTPPAPLNVSDVITLAGDSPSIPELEAGEDSLDLGPDPDAPSADEVVPAPAPAPAPRGATTSAVPPGDAKKHSGTQTTGTSPAKPNSTPAKTGTSVALTPIDSRRARPPISGPVLPPVSVPTAPATGAGSPSASGASPPSSGDVAGAESATPQQAPATSKRGGKRKWNAAAGGDEGKPRVVRPGLATPSSGGHTSEGAAATRIVAPPDTPSGAPSVGSTTEPEPTPVATTRRRRGKPGEPLSMSSTSKGAVAEAGTGRVAPVDPLFQPVLPKASPVTGAQQVPARVTVPSGSQAATPSRGNSQDAASQLCDCTLRGTVEVQADRPLSSRTEVVISIEDAPEITATAELFMGSPRAFEIHPAPCGVHRLLISTHSRQRFVLVSSEPRLVCTPGGVQQMRLVLEPVARWGATRQ